MTHERLRLLILYGAGIALAGGCLVILRPFLGVFAWSVTLAVLLGPLHGRLRKRISSPSLAAFTTCLCFAGLVLLPGLALAAQVMDEARPLLRHLQAASSSGWLSRWLSLAKGAGPAPHWLQFHLGVTATDIQSFLRQTLGQVSGALTRYSLNAARNLMSLLAELVLVLVTCFFLLRDSARIQPLLWKLFPVRWPHLDRLLQLAADTLRASAYSQGLVAIVQGSLGGLAFWVLGLPSPLLWGAVMVVSCLVPVLGSPVVWVPAAIYLLFQGAYWKAIALAAWGLLVVGTIDNLMRPLLMGAQSAIHPLVMFFGMLGGVIVIGPLGLVVGPVLLVLTRDALEMIGREVAADPPPPGSPVPADGRSLPSVDAPEAAR